MPIFFEDWCELHDLEPTEENRRRFIEELERACDAWVTNSFGEV